ncbi:GntR family transcriptional regulator [Sporosarcina sp. HYO08]|uniref:GntR family transcriptional regulator n=1 Tax=Sporosarcina sp. HYO08 TaxID=1759557 RepID=UPI0007995043|nr:GntR family transcriptional regulator [Sporosarcina sp. HYO08]KXH87277.1 GntR family transcriptional regulator [Sporosarcina sp. HYO08]
MLEMDGSKPIYVQIAEWLEKEIIDETLKSDEKVYSQYQLADLFNINPATAGKGLTLLIDAEIIYKRRGLGTFVASDAREKLLAKRKVHTLHRLIEELLDEAELLGIDEQHLLSKIRATRNKREGDLR